jgi:hypothetical protein
MRQPFGYALVPKNVQRTVLIYNDHTMEVQTDVDVKSETHYGLLMPSQNSEAADLAPEHMGVPFPLEGEPLTFKIRNRGKTARYLEPGVPVATLLILPYVDWEAVDGKARKRTRKAS